MEKKKTPERKPALIEAYSELVNRALLAGALGKQQYSGDRDIYQALGYLKEITFADYLERYIRQDIANAIVTRPVEATWVSDVGIAETDDDNETPFEKAYSELDNRLGLKYKYSQVDKLTGIGRYGVLLLGLSDTKVVGDFAQPVGTIPSSKRELMYIKALTEEAAQINKFVDNPSDPRYGLPEFYDITVADAGADTTSTILVHYTRVIHVIDSTLESEVYGTPRLEAVFNRLMDLEKIVGGSAEMFWRGARPGYQGILDKDYNMTTAVKEALIDQIDEYEHNLRRMLVNEGIKYEPLTSQVADPAGHIDVQIQMISAQTGIPKRILTGSERGELSSDQDKTEWLTKIHARQLNYAEPRIVRVFIDRLVEIGVLPKPQDRYTVMWEDLFSITMKEKAEIGRIRATALKEYAMSPMAESIIPADAFLEHIIGFDKEEIELIKEQQEAVILKEPSVTEEENEMLGENV